MSEEIIYKLHGLQELKMIMHKLNELEMEALEVMEEYFPRDINRLQAYDALTFGKSSNKFDTTLEAFINDVEEFYGENEE